MGGCSCERARNIPIDFNMLIKEELYAEKVTDSLTTKFVHDWRVKDFTLQSGEVVKRWLRRSRLVAREYAFLERRDDCFRPATSCHVTICYPWSIYSNATRDVDVRIKPLSTFWVWWTSKMPFYVYLKQAHLLCSWQEESSS